MTVGRVTQGVAEALSTGAPNGRVTQAIVEVLSTVAVAVTNLDATQAAITAAVSSDVDQRITQAAALVLSGHDIGARVSQVAVLVMVKPAPPCETHWTQCWKVTRQDGEVLAFTTHDEDVVHAGLTYKRCDSLKATAVASTAASGQATGDVQVTGILSDLGISEADIAAGRYDNAKAEALLVDWQTGASKVLARGLVTTVVSREGSYTITALTGGARLEQQPLLDVYSPLCRWELGDSRCQFNVEGLRISSVVTDTVPKNVVRYQQRRMFLDAARTEPVETYRNGRLTWTSGANTGLLFEVKDIVDGLVTLWATCPFEIAAGDTYTMVPGCGKTKDDCISRYNNYVNFGGFPDLPGDDAINQTPNRA